MIVGVKNRFAVEFELDPRKLADVQLSEWLYGRVRWWCGGEALGMYEDDTTLRDVQIETERTLVHAGGRRQPDLMEKSSDKVFSEIWMALRLNDDRTDAEVTADELRYGACDVGPAVDVFDSWNIFLVEDAERARLLWRRMDEPIVREQQLAAGEFDDVLRIFLAALRTSSATTAQHEVR